MKEFRLGAIEARFADLVWANAPISTAELIRLCEGEFGWKRTTTYTVIKRLSERGVVKNENGTVTSLVSKAQVQAAELEEMMDKTFENSLPAFLTAFARHKGLTEAERADLLRMIEEWDEGGGKNS